MQQRYLIRIMSNEGTSPTTSAARVFAIPELLERIIIQIPQYGVETAARINSWNMVDKQATKRQIHLQQIRPILCAQRVDKTFHNTIAGSRACMSAIFREHAFYEGLHAENSVARFNPVLSEILKLECAEYEAIIDGNRMDCFILVWYEHFEDLESELKRIEMQGAPGGTWQDALVCNMPAWLRVNLTVASGERRVAYSSFLREAGIIRKVVQLFVDETRESMRQFERQFGERV